MRFRWNNKWQEGLTVNQRQQVGSHERNHLAFAKLLSDDEKNQASKEIRDFQRGYACQEPLEDGKMCILDARPTGRGLPSTDGQKNWTMDDLTAFNDATDKAVERVLNEQGISVPKK